MNIFSNPDDDDEIQSSRFAMHLKKETYDQLMITFNNVTSGSSSTKNEKSSGGRTQPTTQSAPEYSNAPKVLTQTMLKGSSTSASSSSSSSSSSCDYVVNIPTSFVVSKDQIKEFYKDINKFKQTKTDLKLNDATASVFMQSDMFEQFVKFVKKNAHKRELVLIEQSYNNAIDRFKPLTSGMDKVWNLTVLATNLDVVPVVPTSKPTADLNERFVILYTTPISPALDFLPLASEFVNTGKFNVAISQKALTYFYNYFQYLYMKAINGTNYSVGRIPNYLPALTSNIAPTVTGTPVHYQNVAQVYAKPSYNVEVIPNFLIGIITGEGLPNRATLSNRDKFKVIRDNTHLYTFKSTPDNSMNYDALLKQLYYKYPCCLTPNAILSKDAMKKIATASKAAAVAAAAAVVLVVTPFNTFLIDAINECDKTKSHSIICAVAIAAREFIDYTETAIGAGGGNSTTISNDLFNTIDFGAAVRNDIKLAILTQLQAAIPANQLNPLIGAACAAGDAVYAAAKRAITSVVMADTAALSAVGMTAIRNAMNRVINNLNNFAAFMYDNNTMLRLLKYSDQPQMVNAAFNANNILPQNLLENADYLKTLYQPSPPGTSQSQSQLEKQKFDEMDDEMLYIICGPVYFDYTWIFKQNPELIKHILGEDKSESKDDAWRDRTDPLTENKHYVKGGQKDPNYPKTRFDVLPDSLPKNCKEIYVSPSLAKTELDNVVRNVAEAAAFTNVAAVAAMFAQWNVKNQDADRVARIVPPTTIQAAIDWTTPGYYRYEITNTVANPEVTSLAQATHIEQKAIRESTAAAATLAAAIAARAGAGARTSAARAAAAAERTATAKVQRLGLLATPSQLTNRFTQLMRPRETGVQDYTEPNLPTAYPPPLMFATPEMRGPDNSFMMHAWIPDLSSENSPSYSKFMTNGPTPASAKVLKRDAYTNHLYKMMHLIFETAIKNAKNMGINVSSSYNPTAYNPYGFGSSYSDPSSSSSSSSSSNKICIKIMAVGYRGNNRNLKAVTDDNDKVFIGDAFFNAVRDYSMQHESKNVHVAIHYDANQQAVKQRYSEYKRQRESVLLRSQGKSLDNDLKLTIQPMEDFFTLRYSLINRSQLKKTDLLYFVDYCSTSRAFIGNCGEWPENIEDVMDKAITNGAAATQPLLQCLYNALASIARLYANRNINEKITEISQNLAVWNAAANTPKTLVANYDALKTAYLDYNADNTVHNAFTTNRQPRNINVSWWQGNDGNNQNSLPRNAYMSSFDEHVLILHNLLNNTNAAAVAVNASRSRWVGAAPAPRFAAPDHTAATENVTANYGPLIDNDDNNNPRLDATFENAVYAYTQAKKILTLLTKMGSDGFQILQRDQAEVKTALDALTVDMSWSLDAKLTAAVGEGAFIPNSSALHNPFMCTKLLDPKEWQFIDFEDIASRNVTGTYPLPLQLNQIVQAKISSRYDSGYGSRYDSGYDSRYDSGYDSGYGSGYDSGYGSRYGSRYGSGNSSIPKSIVISKQPNIGVLRQNIGIILENLFQKNAPIGNQMVLNDYAWPDKRIYSKIKRDLKINDMRHRVINFAELSGIKQPSGCVQFPLFVIHLMLYTFEGNLSDMTGMDKASLSCALDGNMLKTNTRIMWDQMMENMKAKQNNFTTANILKRLGVNAEVQEFNYTAYFDGDPSPVNAGPIHSATILINCTNAATNPTLQTTNCEKLNRMNNSISATALAANAALYGTALAALNLPAIDPTVPYNSIRSLAKIAEIFNDVEMHGVAGDNAFPSMQEMQGFLVNLTNVTSTGGAGQYTPQPITQGWNSRIGWNAAKQIESTVLYMNVNARFDGTLKNITLDLKALKPGDKILITTVNAPVNKQMWLVEGVPKENPTYPNVINVPVSFLKIRLTNLNTIVPGDDNITNDARLKVELQRFT